MVFWMFHGKDPLTINRIAAQLIDYLLFFLMVGVASLFLPFMMETPYTYLFALAVPVIWIPIEALLVSTFKTTPGKALFGITIHDLMGQRLSFGKALLRAAWIRPKEGVIRQVSLSLKRRFAGLCIGIACILASFFGTALTRWSMGWDQGITTEGWVQYESEEAGFTVQFPNDPKEESKQLPIPSGNRVLNYQEVSSQQNRKIHYSVSHMNFPSKWKWAGASTLLKGAIDAIVKHSPNTQLVGRQFSYHQGHRAMDFRLKQGENEVRGRLIIVGTKLYKLTVTYPASYEPSMGDNPFIPSFDLQSN